MKTFKRPLSILLTLLMLLSMVTVGSISANAAVTPADSSTEFYSSSSYRTIDVNNETPDDSFLDDMGMDYRDWNQDDPRWKNIPLGSSSTVGAVGCLMISTCKLIISAGLATPRELTPTVMVKWLNANNGFSGNDLSWDKVEEFCEEVLGKKFTINTTVNTKKAPYNSTYGGTGEQNIVAFDETGYTIANRKTELMRWLQEGYHLLINVHDVTSSSTGAHWIAIDEIATKNSNYETLYIMNTYWGDSATYQGDGTDSRCTLEKYINTETTHNTTSGSFGNSYGMKGKFCRVAAYKTDSSYSTINDINYSKTDEYKKWSRNDPRWATSVLDNPSSSKAEYLGDWGQEVLAVSKALIQAGVKKSDSFNPADCVTALTNSSAIETSGTTIGRAIWNNVKNLDSEILDSGAAYSSSTAVSSVKDDMLENIKKNGYHYVIHTKSTGNADDTWLAVDEERSLAENDIYVLSSNADVSANSGRKLSAINSGSFAEAYYFTTEPAKTVYLDATGEFENNRDNVEYRYAWTFKDGAASNEGKWLEGTVDSKGLIKFEGVLDNIIFVRMNKNAGALPNWDAKWNQTGDLDAEDGDLYTLTGFSGDTLTGTWSYIKGDNKVYVYAKPLKLRGDYDVYLWNWDEYGSGWANEYTETEDGYIIYSNVKDNFKAFAYAEGVTPPANECKNYIAQSSRGNSPISDGDLLVLDKITSGTTDLIDYQYDYSDINREKSYEDIRLDEKQWKNVTLGTSTTASDKVSNYTQVQAYAKLVKQAFPNSDLDVADFAAAYCNSDGNVNVTEANVKKWGFSWYKDEYNISALNVNTISSATDEHNIYNYLRNGHHVLLRLNNAAASGVNVADEWVVVDEARTLAANGEQIYIYRTTNSDSLNKGTTLQSTGAGITRILLFDGGENPCLDYRYWSRYDTKWKDYNLVRNSSEEGTSVRYLGAAAVAMTKLLLQAGCRGWDYTGTSNNFTNYSTSDYENSFNYDVEDFVGYMLSINAFASDGGIDWTKLHNFNHSDIESANSDDLTPDSENHYHSYYSNISHKLADSGNNYYHFFANLGDVVFDYPDSHDLQATAQLISGMSDYTYDTAQKEKLIDAIKKGYHLMIRAQSTGGAGTWVAVDEKTTIQNNYDDIYVMDSERNVSKNVMTLTDWLGGGEGTTVNRQNKFWRVVAYTGGTKELYDDVQEEVVENEQIDSVTKTALLPKTSDPAFIGADTVNNYYRYAYDKIADLSLKLNGATIGYKYRYALFDSKADAQEASESFNNREYDGYSYFDVVSTSENTVEDIMTVELPQQLSTKNSDTLTNIKNKYVVVQTIVLDENDIVSSYSNTLTASLAYKAEEQSDFTVNFYRCSPDVENDDTHNSVEVTAPDNKLAQSDYYENTFDLGNGYVFKGWYEDRNSEEHPVNINRTYDSDTDLYAHWIATGTIDKDDADDNIISGQYSGFGLEGVQIREAGADSNFRNQETGEAEIKPGGLRFITSLSQSMLNEIDSIQDGTVDGDNVEYGYVATRKDFAKKYAEHYNMLEGDGDYASKTIKDSYKLKYVGDNVNGINTNPSGGYTVDNDFRFITNVDCTSADYKDGGVSKDHKKYENYRLYSLVITYGGAEDDIDNDCDIIARAYIKYTDANGLLRVRYDNYSGASNVCGGCCTSYNTVKAISSDNVKINKED